MGEGEPGLDVYAVRVAVDDCPHVHRRTHSEQGERNGIDGAIEQHATALRGETGGVRLHRGRIAEIRGEAPQLPQRPGSGGVRHRRNCREERRGIASMNSVPVRCAAWAMAAASFASMPQGFSQSTASPASSAAMAAAASSGRIIGDVERVDRRVRENVAQCGIGRWRAEIGGIGSGAFPVARAEAGQ